MTTVALLGAPWDGSSSFQRGAAGAPAKIREALWSPSSNSWNERGDDIAAAGVLADAGDLELPANAAETRTAIERGVRHLLGRDRRPLILGGDHSITYPILRAFSPRTEPLTIVHLDAHGDLYDCFEDDRYSHACPFARVMDEQLATRLVQIGIRTLPLHLKSQVAKHGVEVFMPSRWRDALPVVGAIEGDIYVSLDLDVLEPMLAPGLSHPEPGGLTVREVLDVLAALRGRVIGADVVEYNPANDFRDLTARVAAKFVKEIVGLMQQS